MNENTLLTHVQKCNNISVHMNTYIYNGRELIQRHLFDANIVFKTKENLTRARPEKKKQIRNRYCIFLRVK